MNLQDVVFMKSLIEASYRRRLLYLIINISIIIICTFLLTLESSISKIYLIVGLFAAVRLTWVYIIEGENPWEIKKEQLSALNQNYKKGLAFERLRSDDSLKEYFL